MLAFLIGCAFIKVHWMSRSRDLQIFEGSNRSRKGEHNLPSLHSPFVGRDANVSKITNMLLTDPFVQAVHITGAPAIGKTRLAVQVGFNLAEHGVDVCYRGMALGAAQQAYTRSK